jgi:hypothetical protein
MDTRSRATNPGVGNAWRSVQIQSNHSVEQIERYEEGVRVPGSEKLVTEN